MEWPPSAASRSSGWPVSPFHSSTFRLLGVEPSTSDAAVRDIEDAGRRVGLRLPESLREWYSNEGAIEILARYSNQDWPISPRDFAVTEWQGDKLLPFKNENQGVCVWAVVLDGSDDPPVYVDVDSHGTQWNEQAPTFSAYIYSCVWDYTQVIDQPASVRAQNGPLSSEAGSMLRDLFAEQPPTFGWPGSSQRRFQGKNCAILIWSGEDQADWFIGARDAPSMEEALSLVWNLDAVGHFLYGCSEFGEAALENVRRGRQPGRDCGQT